MIDKSSVLLIGALNKIWDRIRQLHTGVPEVVLLARPSIRQNANVMGHFTALSWRTDNKLDSRSHEVDVVAEQLSRSPKEIVGILLHEAAHIWNYERGIFDCSTTCRYHNRKFKTIAEELGLSVKQVPYYGFSVTSMTEDTCHLFTSEIDYLEKILISREQPAKAVLGIDDSVQDAPINCRSLKAVCKCPHIIRVSRKTLSEINIRCEKCNSIFSLV